MDYTPSVTSAVDIHLRCFPSSRVERCKAELQAADSLSAIDASHLSRWIGAWFQYPHGMDKWFPYPHGMDGQMVSIPQKWKMHRTDGQVGGFHIQAAPVSKSSRALAPTAPQSPVTLNLAPFTITRQKLENSHKVYLPSLCIAFIALDKKRTTTRQENEEEKKI